MIKVTNLNTAADVPFDAFIFPGGETQVRLQHVPQFRLPASLLIRADLHSGDDVMKLLMITDALDRAYGPDLELRLKLPYLPYARQDRVAYPGEALGAVTFARLINAQLYKTVEVWDAHSDVSLALLERVINVEQWRFAREHMLRRYSRDQLQGGGRFFVIAPDAGAAKKIHGIRNFCNAPILTASKVRDTRTGAITATQLTDAPDELEGATVLIIDDICDGGRTFIELAKVLREVHRVRYVHLFVTHGIFSKGTGVFDGLIDELATANLWPNVPHDPKLFLTDGDKA